MPNPPISQLGDPPWEIATLFPAQGSWYEHEYLALPTNRPVEFVDGRIEILPSPAQSHQLILGCLLRCFDQFVRTNDLGTVVMAAFPIRLREGLFRTPDLDFIGKHNYHRRGDRYWDGADFVVEVVSEDDPDRDWKTKRAEYAVAGIPEYWIVDPRDETVTVLTLPEGKSEYAEAGKYTRGQTAASVLLDGFEIDVHEVFSQS